jgi:endonuclease-3
MCDNYSTNKGRSVSGFAGEVLLGRIVSISKKKRVEQIRGLLVREYGRREWRSRGEPISVLVQTILSQNTSDTNSGRAFKSLQDTFGSWDKVAESSTRRIASAIKCGGLGEVKARYIKQALEEIRQRRGGFDLGFLKQLPLEEARNWLTTLPGVGMKTASCVLLFGLGMPALPVDTHVFRVARRLGLLDSRVNAEQAHRLLESLVPVDDVYEFHILLIEHGRKVCRARNPLVV